jgi:gamma-D-glutamyl-L-lysine dipeptidyl-peptidase
MRRSHPLYPDKRILMQTMLAAALLAAVVLCPVTNMYSGASEDADVVSQAIFGANVNVLEEKDGRARIRTADGYTGWAPLAALRTGQTYAAGGRVAEVASLFAHLYREASVTRHAPLLTVPFETRLEVVAEPTDNPRWLQVRLPDDRPAWVQSADIVFNPKTLSIPEMLSLAKRFLGLPYTWGGTSSFGYDCSGFAQMLCRRRGVLMPRDAQPQADWSGLIPVTRDQLQPGDLLYFGASAKKITHTGIYLGESRFINATTYETPVVRIDHLDEPHWTNILVAMRRVK